jgi:hypothetical protein
MAGPGSRSNTESKRFYMWTGSRIPRSGASRRALKQVLARCSPNCQKKRPKQLSRSTGILTRALQRNWTTRWLAYTRNRRLNLSVCDRDPLASVSVLQGAPPAQVCQPQARSVRSARCSPDPSIATTAIRTACSRLSASVATGEENSILTPANVIMAVEAAGAVGAQPARRFGWCRRTAFILTRMVIHRMVWGGETGCAS